MAGEKIAHFKCVLQPQIKGNDTEWRYDIPQLPRNAVTDPIKLMKIVTVTSNTEKQVISLSFSQSASNRIISGELPSKFINISFADFRLQYPVPTVYSDDGNKAAPSQSPRAAKDGASQSSRRAEEGTQSSHTMVRSGLQGPGQASAVVVKGGTARESAEYIVRLLQVGIVLNGITYNFYGHSNSQLKSRTCLLYAASKEEISEKIEALGNFSKIKTVGKKAKRIGLMFSSAEVALNLDPKLCEDIPDVQSKDYIFTDGCGLISRKLSDVIVKKRRIRFRYLKYIPSVFQIRYQGYKGVLTLDPRMTGKPLAKFRDSMKKFQSTEDQTFSVVAYSKPYSFGSLNDEMILLINCLGISTDTLLKKQSEHFDYLAQALVNPAAGFRFLSYINRLDLAEKLLIEGIEEVKSDINKLVNEEFHKMLNKRTKQKCRILIPKSRLVFGVCDQLDTLKEGECFFRITMDGDGRPLTIVNMEILVSRNPCLHPGDVRKFKAVRRDELNHLVDCIVFPTQGKRPHADMMSGGDLDGDQFFVCWDPDLVPRTMAQPAEYPGGKEPIKFGPITDNDRLEYFARYNNMSLGRTKSLYMDWVRIKGCMAPECQELNRLFSSSVDGLPIRIPPRLEKAPDPDEDTPPLILDILHQSAETYVQNRQKNKISSELLEGYTFDAVELLLARDDLAVSEFELVKLTHTWCIRNKAPFDEFVHFFDFSILDATQKLWVLERFSPQKDLHQLVSNALNQSNILKLDELRPFKLQYPALHWKRIYSSAEHRMATFLDFASHAFSLFDRKLVVIRVDERLSIALYIPRRIDVSEEVLVDDSVRLFAFPHSHDGSNRHRLAVPTKQQYRLYCDDGVFQLYENQRANTWVFIQRAPKDQAKYRNIKGSGDRRRVYQQTLDSGINKDWVVSVALDKFSRNLQTHIGRVNRNAILEAEIYVISNRDIRGKELLDLWIQQIDTEEVVPLFEKKSREYEIPKVLEVDWAARSPVERSVLRDKNLADLSLVGSVAEFHALFTLLSEQNEMKFLAEIFQHLQVTEPNSNSTDAMISYLQKEPLLSISFVKNLCDSSNWLVQEHGKNILKALILSANQMSELILSPFRNLIERIDRLDIEEFADLVETVSLTISSSELALDLLLEIFEPHALRLLGGNKTSIEYFLKKLFGIALEHIDEITGNQSKIKQLLNLELKEENFITANFRIDTPITEQPRIGDHVKLIVVGSPTNKPIQRPYSMICLVEKSFRGIAEFRFLHPPPRYLKECSWRLINYGSFVTTKTMYQALRTLMVGKMESCAVYSQLLNLNSSPRMTEEHEYRNNKLNPSQNEAIRAALNSALTCLWGPPGTGKTHTICSLLKELLFRHPSSRILVAAPSNNAVDNVMQKFMKSKDKVGNILPIRVATDVRRVAADLQKYTCDAMVGHDLSESHKGRKAALKRVKEARIAFTTCAGAGLGLLRSEDFDIVLIDEASQQTEPTTLIPIVKKSSKVVLVGDHVQLRATVQMHALTQEFDVSLFERLYLNASNEHVAKVMLDTQYRMHDDICQFSSKEFYDGKLRTGLVEGDRPIPLTDFKWPKNNAGRVSRTLFIQCSESEDCGRRSKSNKAQAVICQEICKQLLSSEKPPHVALLTPYTAQVGLLKKYVPRAEVATIDGFQGREAEIVIFVTVRCNLYHEKGFLKDLKRLNVALTRAKTAMIVIGDEATLTTGNDPESDEVWTRLINGLAKLEWSAE